MFNTLKDLVTSSDSEKKKDLQAFRTIITMLSRIQSPNSRSSETAPIGVERQDRRALRVLDALSALLVRSYEITAVVAQKYDGSHFQVLASAVLPSDGKAESLLQPGADSGGQTFWSRVSNFTVSINPRITKINGHEDSLINKTSLPLIEDYDISKLEDLAAAAKDENKSVLDIYLKTYW